MGEIFRKYKQNFFSGLDSSRANVLLKQHPELNDNTLNIDELRASAGFLTQKEFSPNEILKHPESLLINQLRLSHRLKVLDECCFQKHKVLCLYKFNRILTKRINLLKMHSLIDQKANVCEKLVNLLDVQIKLPAGIDDEASLNRVRDVILKLYLKKRLSIPEGSRILTCGPLKYQSLESIVKVIDILQNQLNFNQENIVSNHNLLLACPDNFSKLITEVPTIADVPISEIIQVRPSIALLPVESIQSSLRRIKSFDIPEDRVLNFLDILSLPPDTIRDRLMQVSKERDFNVFWSHPKMLRLIFYQEAARTKLDYVDKLNLKYASLSILAGSFKRFKKYSREGTDQMRGDDAVAYLAKYFKKRANDIEHGLRRHPHWRRISANAVKAAVDYLRYKKFTDEEIYENLYILLYPVTRIEKKLTPLLEGKKETNGSQMISGALLSTIPNSKLLNLCLYYIEAEFHFSGDGVWFQEYKDVETDPYPTTLSELQPPQSKAKSC